LLCFATEQLSLRVGNALGGLLNATFGNAVELLISILALTKGRIGLVQAAMVGSILSNTLLVLGMCYFAGGLRFHEQMYTVASSQVQISLLGLSIAAIVLPAGYHLAVEALGTRGTAEASHILAISRGLSFMLLSVYVMYLVFILYSEWERFFCGEELCVADWVVWVPDAFDQLMRSECRTPAWPANAGI
jgi:Ca2+:H+ antiporter